MIFKLIRSQTNLTFKSSFNRAFSQTKLFFQQATKPGTSSTSGLYALRKATGYALNKCREALEKNNGDIQTATQWLNEQAQREGWAKAEKLKNRSTSQGTLALYIDNHPKRAILVEINCETDFVARNEKFLDFSSNIAKSMLQNVSSSSSKLLLPKDELIKFSYLESGKTIGDQLALSIGNLGENMSIRRAVVFNLAEGQSLSWYMHGSTAAPTNSCNFGKFGALVNISLTQKNENFKPFDIGRQLSQHIVGMKPKTIGEMPPPLAVSHDADGKPEPLKLDDNENRLLHQEFLMKNGIRVADFLRENHTVLNDFVRFECGEVLESEN